LRCGELPVAQRLADDAACHVRRNKRMNTHANLWRKHSLSDTTIPVCAALRAHGINHYVHLHDATLHWSVNLWQLTMLAGRLAAVRCKMVSAHPQREALSPNFQHECQSQRMPCCHNKTAADLIA
jgi:hypothetical protein